MASLIGQHGGSVESGGAEPRVVRFAGVVAVGSGRDGVDIRVQPSQRVVVLSPNDRVSVSVERRLQCR